jgi:hypothetical protein
MVRRNQQRAATETKIAVCTTNESALIDCVGASNHDSMARSHTTDPCQEKHGKP